MQKSGKNWKNMERMSYWKSLPLRIVMIPVCLAFMALLVPILLLITVLVPVIILIGEIKYKDQVIAPGIRIK